MCPCLGRASWLDTRGQCLSHCSHGLGSASAPYGIQSPVSQHIARCYFLCCFCENEWFPLPLQQSLTCSRAPAVLLSAGQLTGLCSVLPSIPVTTSMTIPSLPALRDVSVRPCPEGLCPPLWSQAAVHPWCQPAAGQQSRGAGAMCCWCCLLAHSTALLLHTPAGGSGSCVEAAQSHGCPTAPRSSAGLRRWAMLWARMGFVVSSGAQRPQCAQRERWKPCS